jgi:CPA1 family monovalent cation:H+ antiporter
MLGVTSLMSADVFLLLVLALTALTVVLAPKVKVPPTVGLVLVGLLLNVTGLWHVTLDPQLIFYVLLPVVIFEASFNLEARDFVADWPRTVFLAFPGVGIMCVVVGLGMHLLGQPYVVAFLFAAIVAATDPVSVVALFRDVGVAPRLRTIIESESIMNDGAGAAVFAVTVAIFTTGGANFGWAAGKLLWMCLGGMAMGSVLALGALLLLRLFHEWNDWQVTLTLSLILAYGSFMLAQHLGASGVLSAMMAGFIMGNYGHHGRVSADLRETIVQFWEYGAFVVNGLVFLLVGLVIDWRVVGHDLTLVAAGFILTLLARAAIVYGWDVIARIARLGPLPASWNHILWWGGLRGTVPVALLLTLPPTFPHLALIRALVLGTVMASLLIEGTTLPFVVARLGLLRAHSRRITPVVEAVELLAVEPAGPS